MVQGTTPTDARLNVLLTLDRPHGVEHWTTQLPRMLEPQGVAAYAVGTVSEAVAIATKLPIHAAIVDLGTPLGQDSALPRSMMGGMSGFTASGGMSAGGSSGVSGVSGVSGAGGGMWVLELFRRLPHRPPVVVIHSPARSRREGNWILSQTLRLGAFSVLNKPVQMDQLLAVFQRLVDRQYQGIWPGQREGN